MAIKLNPYYNINFIHVDLAACLFVNAHNWIQFLLAFQFNTNRQSAANKLNASITLAPVFDETSMYFIPSSFALLDPSSNDTILELSRSHLHPINNNLQFSEPYFWISDFQLEMQSKLLLSVISNANNIPEAPL